MPLARSLTDGGLSGRGERPRELPAMACASGTPDYTTFIWCAKPTIRAPWISGERPPLKPLHIGSRNRSVSNLQTNAGRERRGARVYDPSRKVRRCASDAHES